MSIKNITSLSMGLYKLKEHLNNKIIIDKVNIALIKTESYEYQVGLLKTTCHFKIRRPTL